VVETKPTSQLSHTPRVSQFLDKNRTELNPFRATKFAKSLIKTNGHEDLQRVAAEVKSRAGRHADKSASKAPKKKR
jgi:hypothetical protein